MSFMHLTTEGVAAAIEAALPCPGNILEEGRYLLDLDAVLKDLGACIRERFNELLPELRNEESKTYRLRQVTKEVRAVDVARLREERPDILSRIAYVYAFDAEKLLGKPHIYELCAALPGFKPALHERANLGDLEKTLAPQEAARFIKTEQKPAGWEIVLRDEEEEP